MPVKSQYANMPFTFTEVMWLIGFSLIDNSVTIVTNVMKNIFIGTLILPTASVKN